MAKFRLSVIVNIEKDGGPFYYEEQISHNLNQEQMLEMERDLWAIKKKWAKATGLEA